MPRVKHFKVGDKVIHVDNPRFSTVIVEINTKEVESAYKITNEKGQFVWVLAAKLRRVR
jgi:hypothetical protein